MSLVVTVIHRLRGWTPPSALLCLASARAKAEEPLEEHTELRQHSLLLLAVTTVSCKAGHWRKHPSDRGAGGLDLAVMEGSLDERPSLVRLEVLVLDDCVELLGTTLGDVGRPCLVDVACGAEMESTKSSTRSFLLRRLGLASMACEMVARISRSCPSPLASRYFWTSIRM